MGRYSTSPAPSWAAASRRLSPTARLLLGGAAALLLFQVLVFAGFHSRNADAAARLAREAALERQLAAVAEDNAQLRAMYKHLESQLTFASAELSARGLISEEARREMMQQVIPEPRGGGSIFPAGNEHRGCTARPADTSGIIAAVVMVTFNRPSYLQKASSSLLSVHRRDPSYEKKFPLYISQDGSHQGVKELALSLGPRVKYMQHIEDAPPKLKTRRENAVYYRIANHYKFIMQQMFDCRRYERLLFVEDDMLFAPDFFSYFEAMSKILDQDPTLMCVSSWNDHGQKAFVSDPRRVVRSDFFPGLGWMLRRETWDGLADRWPAAYWDDWMRREDVRRGRQCLRPEVCRTYNFGERGSSRGQFYYRYLVPIKLNTAAVPWGTMDLSYLKLAAYDADFNRTLAAAKTLRTLDEVNEATGDVKVLYNSQKEYETITGRLHMLREWKDGVPRGAYRGTVQISWRQGKVRLFIAPGPGFKYVKPQGEVLVDSSGAVKRVVVRRPLPPRTRPQRHTDSSGSGWWPWQRKKRVSPPPPPPWYYSRRSGGSSTYGSAYGSGKSTDNIFSSWKEELQAQDPERLDPYDY